MVTPSLYRSSDRIKLIPIKFSIYMDPIYLESIYLELHFNFYIFRIIPSKTKRGCVMSAYDLLFYNFLKQGS